MIRWVAAIIMLSMLGTAAYFIYVAGQDSIRAGMAETVSKAVKAARKDEQEKQGKINEALQIQYNKMAGINSQLTDDIARLRNRPDRGHLPDDSRANCKGATGAELSAADAEFLTREVARADRLRTALEACYTYADSITVLQ